MIKQLENASLATFLIAFHCKYAEIVIYHARFCSKDLSNTIFVGFTIGVDAPDVLAALRPWAYIGGIGGLG